MLPSLAAPTWWVDVVETGVRQMVRPAHKGPPSLHLDPYLIKPPGSGSLRAWILGCWNSGSLVGQGSGLWCLSRFGCCPDGVTVAKGPHQAGCTSSYGRDNAGGRPGSKAAASTVSVCSPQGHESSPEACSVLLWRGLMAALTLRREVPEACWPVLSSRKHRFPWWALSERPGPFSGMWSPGLGFCSMGS